MRVYCSRQWLSSCIKIVRRVSWRLGWCCSSAAFNSTYRRSASLRSHGRVQCFVRGCVWVCGVLVVALVSLHFSPWKLRRRSIRDVAEPRVQWTKSARTNSNGQATTSSRRFKRRWLRHRAVSLAHPLSLSLSRSHRSRSLCPCRCVPSSRSSQVIEGRRKKLAIRSSHDRRALFIMLQTHVFVYEFCWPSLVGALACSIWLYVSSFAVDLFLVSQRSNYRPSQTPRINHPSAYLRTDYTDCPRLFRLLSIYPLGLSFVKYTTLSKPHQPTHSFITFFPFHLFLFTYLYLLLHILHRFILFLVNSLALLQTWFSIVYCCFSSCSHWLSLPLCVYSCQFYLLQVI